jgi:hypothetical protein
MISHNQDDLRQRLQEKSGVNKDRSKETQESEDSQRGESDLEVIEVFNKKYEVLNKIGEGSNGVVYRCLKKRNR